MDTAVPPHVPHRLKTSTMSPHRLIDSQSIITAETVALSGVSFSNLRAFGTSVYVACRDPKNAGKTHLLKNMDVVISEHNVRSAVHEYGGGAYCVSDYGIIYTDFPSHILYVIQEGCDEPKVLLQREHCRFADFTVQGSMLYAVMEDHTNPEPSKVINCIVSISLQTSELTVIASGRDFYSCPQSNGSNLAYVAWDHPNMPWDTTQMFVQRLDGASAWEIEMGADCSMAEPRWDGDNLFFLCDITGWYNLYRHHHGKSECVLRKEADFTSPSHGWVMGENPYVIVKSGSIITATMSEGLIKIEDGTVTFLEAPSTAISSLCVTDAGDLYYVGGSTTDPPALWKYSSGEHVLVLPSVDPTILAPLKSLFSRPKHAIFPSAKGRVAHGYFYPPRVDNPDVKPPLLVKAHGGPTSSTSTTFRLDIQYWTTRGFGVLDVDYGGSTGYGKEYRQLLRKQWGIVDVEDVCSGALYCVEQGWANGDWLAIDGRSAGGYTTLAALTFSDVFKAGASLYGVSDLVTLNNDTHKFESRYLEGLIGPYPDDKAIYDERCPIKHTERLDCPVLLLQGDEDKIVPPNQAEMMFSVLKSKGLDTTLVLYKGEQHGFRKGENVQHALNSEYSFFCQVFGIDSLDVTPIEIGSRLEI